jgi:type II secretory pathway component PulK
MNLPRKRFQERGTALIVVMVLLAIMCVFMFCTTQSIFLVKRELQQIEKKQLQRYEKPAASEVRK